MVPIRLTSRPSGVLLLLDVVVAVLALQGALATEDPGWIRVLCALVALAAFVLAIRTGVLLLRRRRGARAGT